MSDKEEKREKLLEKKESLQEVMTAEMDKKQILKIQILNDATAKLDDALAITPLTKKRVTVAIVMLDTTKTKRLDALDLSDIIRKKQYSLD